jgi:Protein of unknown function (DUF4242)
MGVYLVERYLPDFGHEEVRLLVGRLRAASEQMSAAGTAVRYLDSTFVPEEESCFCRIEAASADIAAQVNRIADAPFARISAALTFR